MAVDLSHVLGATLCLSAQADGAVYLHTQACANVVLNTMLMLFRTLPWGGVRNLVQRMLGESRCRLQWGLPVLLLCRGGSHCVRAMVCTNGSTSLLSKVVLTWLAG